MNGLSTRLGFGAQLTGILLLSVFACEKAMTPPPLKIQNQNVTSRGGEYVYITGRTNQDEASTQYKWTQVSGAMLPLEQTNAPTVLFLAPRVEEPTIFTLQLEATASNQTVTSQINVLILDNQLEEFYVEAGQSVFSTLHRNPVTVVGSVNRIPEFMKSYKWSLAGGTPAFEIPQGRIVRSILEDNDDARFTTTFVTPAVEQPTVYKLIFEAVDVEDNTLKDSLYMTVIPFEREFILPLVQKEEFLFEDTPRIDPLYEVIFVNFVKEDFDNSFSASNIGADLFALQTNFATGHYILSVSGEGSYTIGDNTIDWLNGAATIRMRVDIVDTHAQSYLVTSGFAEESYKMGKPGWSIQPGAEARPTKDAAAAFASYLEQTNILYFGTLADSELKETSAYCEDLIETGDEEIVLMCGFVNDYIAHTEIGTHNVIFAGAIDDAGYGHAAIKPGGVFDKHTIYVPTFSFPNTNIMELAPAVLAGFASNIARKDLSYSPAHLKQALIDQAQYEEIDHVVGYRIITHSGSTTAVPITEKRRVKVLRKKQEE